VATGAQCVRRNEEIMPETRKLLVITTCEATVTETWTYEVPAGTDIEAADFDIDALSIDGTAQLLGIEEEVHDERNRETVRVSWQDAD
jgi:hypothetical protein